MGVPEAESRRMRVAGLVRVLVVISVNAGPPQGAFLDRRRTEYAEKKLKSPAGPVAAVREVSVVDAGDGPESNEKSRCAEEEVTGLKVEEENKQTSDLNAVIDNTRDPEGFSALSGLSLGAGLRAWVRPRGVA